MAPANHVCGRPRDGRSKMSSSPLTLLELICMKRWQKAREYIEMNQKAIYETVGTNRRLAIHEVCKLVTYPEDPDVSGEMSDDEDEGMGGGGGGGDSSCLECIIEDNRRLCELAKYMIDVGAALGPVELAALPREGAVADQVEEEGRVEWFDSILTVTDSMGKTPLHILCEHSGDTNMLRTILDSTREQTKHPKSPTASYLLSARDSRGSTPLHYLAYSRSCPFSSIEVMMDHAQPSVSEGDGKVIDVTLCTDDDGDTPLHWALDGYMSARRVGQLIRYNKDALNVRNGAGKLPFDHFVANFIDGDWDKHELCGREIWDNIQGYVKVAVDYQGEQQEDGSGDDEEWYPLHALAGSSINFPDVFLDIALHFSKEDLSKPDSRGYLPLHHACARKWMVDPAEDTSGYEKQAMKILRACPQAAYKAAAGSKRLPIHIALDQQKPMILVAALLKVYPNSLNIKDPRTGLWPFLLAGSCYGDDNIDISYGLLRYDPSIVQLAIRALITKSGRRAAQARRDMEATDYATSSNNNSDHGRRTRRLMRRER